MSGFVEKHNDLLVDFNILKNDNEITENKLNKIKNELTKKNESIRMLEENVKDFENKNISLNKQKRSKRFKISIK